MMQPGDIGFKAPWLVKLLERKFFAPVEWKIVEAIFGNKAGHEVMLLQITQHPRKQQLLKEVQKWLPLYPKFTRIQDISAYVYKCGGKPALAFVEKCIHDYAWMMGTLAVLNEGEQFPIQDGRVSQCWTQGDPGAFFEDMSVSSTGTCTESLLSTSAPSVPSASECAGVPACLASAEIYSTKHTAVCLPGTSTESVLNTCAKCVPSASESAVVTASGALAQNHSTSDMTNVECDGAHTMNVVTRAL